MKIEVNLDFQAYDCGEEPSDESEHIPESQIDDSDDDLPQIVDDIDDDVDGGDGSEEVISGVTKKRISQQNVVQPQLIAQVITTQSSTASSIKEIFSKDNKRNSKVQQKILKA